MPFIKRLISKEDYELLTKMSDAERNEWAKKNLPEYLFWIRDYCGVDGLYANEMDDIYCVILDYGNNGE